MRLRLEAAGRCSHFFHQRSVLLGDLVHLRHSLTDLRHTMTLFGAGGADLVHDVGHALNRGHHLLHGDTGLVHQCTALADTLDAGADQ